MKRISVPDGMLKAALIASGLDDYCSDDQAEIRKALEAALLWASEHPQVPTDEQLQAMREHLLPDMPKGAEHFTSNDLFMGAVEWQRRCFVQEEPEIPEELDDIMFPDLAPDSITARKSELNDLILDAYRRGLRKGEQK